MAITVHRCGTTWLKADFHFCHKLQTALDEAGVEYDTVEHPTFPRGRRKELAEKTGQNLLPVIELEDGTFVREDTDTMAAMARAGKFG